MNNRRAALMGLTMAGHYADTNPVVIYFDVDGIDLVTKDSPDLKMKPYGSSHQVIQDLLKKNVIIYACPGCLESHGKATEDLMPGIKVATKEGLIDFTKGRIITLDY